MPDSLQPAMEAGKRNEPVILAMLKEQRPNLRSATYPELAEMKDRGVIAGYNAEMQQVQVRVEVGKEAVVCSHLDDVVVAGDPVWAGGWAFPVEAKAFGDDYWQQFLKGGLAAFPGYMWQVSAQMHGFRLPKYADNRPQCLLFVVGHKDKELDGLVTEIKVEEIKEPPIPLAEFKAKVLKADRYAKADDIPDCTDPTWPCPYYDYPFHPDAPEKDTLDDAVFAILCREFFDLSGESKKVKDKRDVVRGEIDKYMAEHGIERGKGWKVQGDGFVAEFEWVEKEMPERTMKATTMSYPQVKAVK